MTKRFGLELLLTNFKTRPDNLIEFFHQTINSREEKIRELNYNVNILESVNGALDLGMPMKKIPLFLSSGEDMSSLRRKKMLEACRTGSGEDIPVDIKNPVRYVEGYAIPIFMDIQQIEDRLFDVVDEIECDSVYALEAKEAEIMDMNEMYSEKFIELERTLMASQTQKIKAKIAKEWDSRRTNHRLLKDTAKLIDRMEKAREDKTLFCDLNGPAGF